MIKKSVRVLLKTGLHARPAALFVQEANKYSSDIFLEKEDVRVNAKSIMGIMMLAAEPGSEITILIEGEDEKEAFAALNDLISQKFYEDEK